MNKNLKIALIIAGIIAVIYFWNKKKSDDSSKSDFLGLFAKKGSQKWADKLAKRYCQLVSQLRKLVDLMNAGKGDGMTAKLIKRIESELEDILAALAAYGYAVNESTCKAIKTGGKIYKPGDKIGADCLCKDKRTWGPECCKSFK
jgi:hypothetical protein